MGKFAPPISPPVVVDGFSSEKRRFADAAEKNFIRACLSTTWLKQSLKLIVLIACMTAVIFQLSECIMKLCYPPVSTRTELKINATISYPAMTICRNPPYKPEVLKKYGLAYEIRYTGPWANFPYNKTSLAEFWQEATYPASETINQIALNGQVGHVSMHSTFHFLSGMCHTLIPLTAPKEAGNRAGYSVTLKHLQTGSTKQSPWNVYIHQVTDRWTENTQQNAGAQELIIIPVGQEASVKLTVQQLERVNHPNSPCNSDRSYSATNCEEQCRLEEVSEAGGCSGPWMPTINLPECNNFKAMRDTIVKYLNFTVSTACSIKCAIPCHTTQYSAFIVNRGSILDSFMPAYISQIYVFHASKMITAVREHWDYDLSRFVADAGGSLGFLLGVSVLSLLSMVGKVLQIFTCCGGNKTGAEDNSVGSVRSSMNSITTLVKEQKY